MSLDASLRFKVGLLIGLGMAVAACSSLDEDTPDHVDFALPDDTAWTISTDDSQWHASPSAENIPTFVCAGPQALVTDCCAPPADCQRYPLACDLDVNRCALTFDVQAAHAVDLGTVFAAVADVQGRVFSRVELVALDASVEVPDELPVRSLALFIGPAGLADSASSAAVLLAPLGLLPGTQRLFPGSAARDTLSEFARNYTTPFTLLLTAHVVVPADFQPEGQLQVSLAGTLRAYY